MAAAALRKHGLALGSIAGEAGKRNSVCGFHINAKLGIWSSSYRFFNDRSFNCRRFGRRGGLRIAA